MSGENDSRAAAQPVTGLGSGPDRRSTARISGRLSPSPSTPDLDFYRVELRAGDVLGATVLGEARRLTILDPAGVDVQGNATVDHVAAVDGAHYVAVTKGSGVYKVSVGVCRAYAR